MSKTFTWTGNKALPDGVATFYLLSGTVSARFETFKSANDLYNAIQATLKETRFEARVELLNEISRIKP